MIFRALDGDHDFQFGKGLESYFKDNNAIGANVQTRLLSFLRDCWFDQGAGIDWIRLLGSKSTEEEIKLNCRGIVLQSFGVVRMISIIVSRKNRGLFLQYSIDTIFSERFTQNLEVI